MARVLAPKVYIVACVSLLAVVAFVWHQDTIKALSRPYMRPHSTFIPQFIAEGDSECLPVIPQALVEEAIRTRATCRKFSPYPSSRMRIATVTAHYGQATTHYPKAFQTHLLHSLVHGTEVRVMCDPIIEGLWNKPAFILNLLMEEALKPIEQRLEWIMWADRDTIILDQCRPISSFLPPEKIRSGAWWRHSLTDRQARGGARTKNATAVNLLVTRDFNGLNNGVFLLRVNEWTIALFAAILAFRHYEPNIELPFTEQSAMEHVIRSEGFKAQTQYVPQHWFNAYDDGGAVTFGSRQEVGQGLPEASVRRGDYLVHFAGHAEKGRAIEEYLEMLASLDNVWEKGRVQRNTSQEIGEFWRKLGYIGAQR